ncbi:uncharacterized protein LOC110925382 [Helianthus annuus]|uniref:uncharacterized protein LOC110925382 n=1 Tax=Helianthus annuus TaxID=4232 RepID=UPI000B8F7924|nr:uncharacterized protein LOC110925382 [Helianthus annuus]
MENNKITMFRDQKIGLTLWENYAVTLSKYMNDKDRPAHVVILVHFGTVNIYQGKVDLTNMFEASHVFINSDLDEIKEFNDRYLEKEFSKSSSSKQSCSQVISNAEDEFLNAEDFVLTAFIASIDEEKKVIIVDTVITISNDKPWYYLSCNHCKKLIEEKSTLIEKDDGSFDVLDEKTFECINPDCDVVDVVPVYRYKIPLRSDLSESNVQCLSDSVGNVKCLSKESRSVIGDSVTPDHFDVNDQDQSKFENIKRNLQDVYDVDAVDSSSAKRRNNPGNVQVNDVVKLDLITPKLEK